MVNGNYAVKVTAKHALKGKWLCGGIVSAILLFSYFICLNISSVLGYMFGFIFQELVFNLLFILMFLPIILGALRYFWRILFGANDNPIIIFYYFSEFKLYRKAMTLIFNLAFKVIIFGFFLSIPVFIAKAMSNAYIYDLIGLSIPVWMANLDTFIVFLKILAYVLLAFVMLKYYMAPVLFVADDNMEAVEAIHMSSVITKKTSIDFIYLFFSFFGWFLLSLAVIPAIFTLPYILTSYAVHIRFSVAEYNNYIKQSLNNKFPSYSV